MASLVPDCEISLTTSTQYTAYDHSKATTDCIAMASLWGPKYDAQSRSPVDIVAVIDHSYSMKGNKLFLVKKTLRFIIDQLQSCDRLGLVVYNDLVSVEFPLTQMTKENKEMTKSKVEKIREHGTTNLCGGLLKGMEQIILRDSEQKAKVASVLLFTDGQANCGITSCKEIVAAMKDPTSSLAGPEVFDAQRSLLPLFQGLLPVVPELSTMPEPTVLSSTDFEGTVYTFGFGSDHDGNLLTAISNAANGMYYFIDSLEKIAECFADCLGGLLSVVGQNMMLTIEAQPHCTLGTVHYKNKPKMEADGKKCVVSLGDLQSEEKRDIIISVNLEALETECMAQPMIKVTLSYFNVITRLIKTTSVDLAVDRKLVADLEPNKAVNTQLQRIQIAMALQEVKEIAPINPQDARQKLEITKKLLISATSVHQNPALISDLDDIIEKLCKSEIHPHRSSSSSNCLASFEQECTTQRRNAHCSWGYDTTARSSMRSSALDEEEDIDDVCMR